MHPSDDKVWIEPIPDHEWQQSKAEWDVRDSVQPQVTYSLRDDVDDETPLNGDKNDLGPAPLQNSEDPGEVFKTVINLEIRHWQLDPMHSWGTRL